MYAKKHLIAAGCVGFLLTFLLAFFSCFAFLKHQTSANFNDAVALGTYATSSGKIPDCEYMVFQRDGQYYRYRQFKPLEMGTFSGGEGGIYTLTTAGSGVRQDVLVRENTVYRTDESGAMISYPQIDKIPCFINVKQTDDWPG